MNTLAGHFFHILLLAQAEIYFIGVLCDRPKQSSANCKLEANIAWVTFNVLHLNKIQRNLEVGQTLHIPPEKLCWQHYAVGTLFFSQDREQNLKIVVVFVQSSFPS